MLIDNQRLNLTRQNNLGFTLVELLVGLFLSIFIVGIALTYFVSSSQAFRANTNESVIQENARFSLEFLSQDIRHAGLNPGNTFGTDTDVIYTDAKCTVGETGLADGAAGGSACTRDGAAGVTTNNSDRIAIDYIVDASDSTANVTTVGCNNEAVTVTAGDTVRFASVYWTADLDGDGTRSLYCQTLNLASETAEGVALPIIDGVDRLQVQYGVDNDEDGAVERYQSFTNLGASNKDKVRAVRLALLLNSGLEFGTEANSEIIEARAFTLLDAADDTFTDARLRQIYTTTIALPNARPDK